MIATQTFDSTKLSTRDDSLILNVLDRAGIDADAFQLADTDWQKRRLTAYIASAVEHILAIETLWKNLSTVALQFGAEALHQTRSQFDHQHRARAELVGKVEQAAGDYLSRVGQPAVGAEKIPLCRDALRRMRVEVLNRWATLEDLEEILLEPLQIPNERLLEIAKRNPPPQRWHDENFDPFVPETIP